MDWDVLECVLGELPTGLVMTPCSLAGFRVSKLPHEDYPMLVVDDTRQASGQLLTGLNQQQLERIIFFEGEEYQISPCVVETESGELISAIYFSEGIMPAPEQTDWCFDHWCQHHKDYLLRQSAAYMTWYGKLSAAEADYYWQTYSEEGLEYSRVA